MVKVALITGISGQDGSYLAELLVSKNYEVYGIVRRTSLLYSSTRLDKFRDKIHLEYGDMTDGSALHAFIHSIIQKHPTFDVFEIYNLAAQSHVKISFDIPEYTSLVDGIGTLKILETIRQLPENIRNKIKFYQAGTSEMYGRVLETPQNEKTPFNPVSPYACAKLYAYYITKNYREAYSIFACNGILFNHESPRRGKNFVTMKIIDGIKSIMKGNNKTPIKLGNIDSKRDWGHAKDFVHGMWQMMQHHSPDDFVLATGITTSVRTFIERAFHIAGKEIIWEGEGLDEVGKDTSTGNTVITIDKKYFRPCEVDILLGDASKMIKTCGWSCNYNLDQLIEDMLYNTDECD